MLDLGILLAIVLGLSNGRLAAAKGQNRTLWIFLSALAFYMLAVFAAAFMLFAVYHSQLLADPFLIPEISKEFSENLSWTQNLLLLAVGFGGYLLIRYILERMPDNQTQGGSGPQL